MGAAILFFVSLGQDLPPPSHVISLRTVLGHVQGIEVEGKRLWVTDVDTKARRGRLHLFSLPNGDLLRMVDITRGEQYHPGGIAMDAGSIWVPVAEYKRESSTTIERRDKKSLKLLSSFPVRDHIGAVAVDGRRIIGANWDARTFYVWNTGGALMDSRPNPTPTAFQDMKVANHILIAGGLRGREGFIEWIDLANWTVRRSLRVGRTERGVPYTQEGLAIRANEIYLLPEDGPSRLFVFRLAGLN